jgi:hypothetical protein
MEEVIVMNKFRYYITDIMNGEIVGTNNQEAAQSYADTECDAFVVDTEDGTQLLPIYSDTPEVKENKLRIISLEERDSGE